MIAIAIVGMGLIGPRHADSVIACKNAELLCIVDPAPRPEHVRSSSDYQWFESIEKMLDAGYKPDGAVVCTPNTTHANIAQELLIAGIDVLVEKPIATEVTAASSLVACAQSNGRQLLVGHHRRFNPYVTTTKAALDKGAIGRPIMVSGIWACSKPASYFEAPTAWRAAADGGGPILINMIHEVDILQYLLGPIVRVHAEKAICQRNHEADEGAAILLRFASGVVGSFVMSDNTVSGHSFEQGTGENPTIPRSGKDFYRIFGSDGTLSVGDMKLTKHPSNLQKSWTSEVCDNHSSVGEEVPFNEQIKHFVRVIRREEEPRCSGTDGISALIVCNAIKQAFKDSRGIDVVSRL